MELQGNEVAIDMETLEILKKSHGSAQRNLNTVLMFITLGLMGWLARSVEELNKNMAVEIEKVKAVDAIQITQDKIQLDLNDLTGRIIRLETVQQDNKPTSTRN